MGIKSRVAYLRHNTARKHLRDYFISKTNITTDIIMRVTLPSSGVCPKIWKGFACKGHTTRGLGWSPYSRLYGKAPPEKGPLMLPEIRKGGGGECVVLLF